MTNITPAAIELVRAIRLRMPVDQEAAAQSALDAYANDKLEQAAQIVWDVSENDVAVHAVRSLKKGEP